jgi:hypothetical protein
VLAIDRDGIAFRQQTVKRHPGRREIFPEPRGKCRVPGNAVRVDRGNMDAIISCGDEGGDCAPCECVWMCGRGRAQLSCQLRRHREDDFEVEVVRNGRLYGRYRFVERLAAVVFASRLRQSFVDNGWIAA